MCLLVTEKIRLPSNHFLGFLGVAVFTAVQTPRFCGDAVSVGRFFNELKPLCRAGEFDFFSDVCLPFLTNWLNVGIYFTSCKKYCTFLRAKKHPRFYARFVIIARENVGVK